MTLKTMVKNEGKTSMDLTCSLPIANAFVDDQDRRFDTIDDLYDVVGNPECNVQLQPGFKYGMQFVYRVPRMRRSRRGSSPNATSTTSRCPPSSTSPDR
ncbi:hypothetical protein [Streptomyces sp. NPDC127066]|uniref:hypothetical protein n=1 Tax=Streptomyces sp. NPDC127066 TaxID=3347125 RepID=UPI00365EC6FA